MGRRRYRRKSTFDELFDVLFELTVVIWQIDAAATAILLFLAYMACNWADAWIATAAKSPVLSQIASDFGWIAYVVPLMFLGLAALFGAKTLRPIAISIFNVQMPIFLSSEESFSRSVCRIAASCWSDCRFNTHRYPNP